jgi:hypothetical protein
MRLLPPPPHVLVALVLAGALAACTASDRGDRGGYYGRGGSLGDIFGGGYGNGRYGGDRVSYRCDDDRRLTVTYYRDGATADAGNRDYDLRAEGRGQYRSRDGDVRLEADRDRAYLRIKDQKDYQDCRAR